MKPAKLNLDKGKWTSWTSGMWRYVTNGHLAARWPTEQLCPLGMRIPPAAVSAQAKGERWDSAEVKSSRSRPETLLSAEGMFAVDVDSLKPLTFTGILVWEDRAYLRPGFWRFGDEDADLGGVWFNLDYTFALTSHGVLMFDKNEHGIVLANETPVAVIMPMSANRIIGVNKDPADLTQLIETAARLADAKAERSAVS